MPLLYWQLTAISPEAVPDAVADDLETYFRANNLRNLSLTGELLKLLKEFEAHEIPAVPYKGPVLAVFAYGNLALREFGDLDILIRRQDVLRAGELLASLGYRPEHRLTRAQEEAFTRYGDQFLYYRDSSVVELHWGFASRAFSFLLGAERRWWHLEQISLGGGTVSTFSPEDLLLILCVHGSMHLWGRLQWVCDIAELSHVRREMDWAYLFEQATAMGCRRALLLGLVLADVLLGASLPGEALSRLQTDPATMILVEDVRARLFREGVGSEEGFEDSLFQPFHLKVMERLRDKVRYCVRQATVPSLQDFELLPLPVPFIPAYRILRPVRLAGKYGERPLRDRRFFRNRSAAP